MSGADDERAAIAKVVDDWITDALYAALDSPDDDRPSDGDRSARVSRALWAMDEAGGSKRVDESNRERAEAASAAIARVFDSDDFAAYAQARVAAAERRDARIAAADARDFEGVDRLDDPSTHAGR